MSKIAVVYWSGTGNTQMMAQKVAQGVQEAGAEAVIFTAAEFSADMMDSFDAVAFGCPSMGAEQLEESEFEPMFSGCESRLKGKNLLPERRSDCLVPTDGGTANGCAPGSKFASRTERYLHAKALYATKLPTVRRTLIALLWASRLSEGLNKNIAVILRRL